MKADELNVVRYGGYFQIVFVWPLGQPGRRRPTPGVGEIASAAGTRFMVIKPMLAVEAREPFDSDAYLFEIKWDGIRCLAFVEAGRVRLQSRELIDITAQFPELEGMAGLPDGTVLDGELVSMRGAVPCLTAVQRRVQLQDKNRIQLLSRSSPVVFIVFDLLYVHGKSIMAKPLIERRGRLEEIVNDFKDAPVVLSEAVLTQGRDLFAAAVDLGQEGIMAKLLDGHYAAGRRTGLWKKIKPFRPKTHTSSPGSNSIPMLHKLVNGNHERDANDRHP